MIATQPPPILQFAEEQSPELRDRIFDEFNSLAVVYQAPSSTFLQEKPQEEVGEVVCWACLKWTLQVHLNVLSPSGGAALPGLPWSSLQLL